MSLRHFLEAQGFYRIPLKKLASSHYKLEAKVNGKKGFFILDTGASTSCIGFNDIDYFNLFSEISEIKASGAGATNMETQLARNNMLAIGEWESKDVDFILFDLSHVNEALSQVDEPAIHGILGADLLKNHRAVIDYGRNALYLK